MTVGSLRKKLKDAHTSFNTATSKLGNLLTLNARYTPEYFNAQWDRQRTLQLSATENENVRDLEEQMIELLELEEKLRDSQ